MQFLDFINGKDLFKKKTKILFSFYTLNIILIFNLTQKYQTKHLGIEHDNIILIR